MLTDDEEFNAGGGSKPTSASIATVITELAEFRRRQGGGAPVLVLTEDGQFLDIVQIERGGDGLPILMVRPASS